MVDFERFIAPGGKEPIKISSTETFSVEIHHTSCFFDRAVKLYKSGQTEEAVSIMTEIFKMPELNAVMFLYGKAHGLSKVYAARVTETKDELIIERFVGNMPKEDNADG